MNSLERKLSRGKRFHAGRSPAIAGLVAACLSIPFFLGRPPPSDTMVVYEERTVASPVMTRKGYDKGGFSRMSITDGERDSVFSPMSAVRRWDGERFYELSRQSTEVFSYDIETDLLATLRFDTVPAQVLMQGEDYTEEVESSLIGAALPFRLSKFDSGKAEQYSLEIIIYYGGEERDGRRYENAERYLVEMMPHE